MKISMLIGQLLIRADSAERRLATAEKFLRQLTSNPRKCHPGRPAVDYGFTWQERHDEIVAFLATLQDSQVVKADVHTGEGSGPLLKPEDSQVDGEGERVAELEATNEDGFEEVVDLRRKLKEMTDARDLCKRQTAQANERCDRANEVWRAEKERADRVQGELDRLRGRGDVGSSRVAAGSVATHPESTEGGERS